MARGPKAKDPLRNYEPELNTGCWLWRGATDGSGYAHFAIPGGKTKRASRHFYEAFKGPIPLGAQVCHRCDTRACVNPAHLFLGTQRDNSLDMVAKGRQSPNSKPTPRFGAENNQTKLSPSDVESIQRDARSYRQIGLAYGVAHSTIRKLKLGLTHRPPALSAP